MNHQDHVFLIKKAVENKKEVWTDLGSGDGAFTLALRDCTDPKTEIYSVDLDKQRLKNQEHNFRLMFPQSSVHFINKNFTKPLALPPLDGIIMANSLHYIVDKVPFLMHIKSYLKPHGKFILVEYNTDIGNVWVPSPLSFSSFKHIAREAGFSQPAFLAAAPSGFLKEIYSALTYANKSYTA